MRVPYRDLAALQQAALGSVKSDLAVQNVKYINVFTGEVYPAVVYVKGGFVCHVEHFCSEADHSKVHEIFDGGGCYLAPGFVDAHVHIESSMCIPKNFARAVVPHGTTTVVTDPHEIANVLGEDGVKYMVDSSENLPMRQLVNVPSCVPAVPGLETGGAEFDADTVDRLAKLPRVAGLAEVMDFVGVATGDARMTSIIEAARRNGLYLQGHLPASDSRWISAYLIGGPNTCHETRTGEDAATKARSGMFVDIRQGSIAQDLATLLPAVKDFRYTDRLCLCTDDKEADDILACGHMDDALRLAVQHGMSGVDAVRCATFNTAREAHLENVGAVAPGYAADMLLIDNLTDFRVDSVFFEGRLVASDGKLAVDIPDQRFDIEYLDTLNVPDLTTADFYIEAPQNAAESVAVHVLSYADPNAIATQIVRETIPVVDGKLDIADMDDLNYVIIINRYGKPNITRGLIRNFGLRKGANASTVSHDCHNLAIVYRDAQSGYDAYHALVHCAGGMCCVVDGVATVLPLPVAGLMSRERCEDVASNIHELKDALRTAGMPQVNPMMRITTIALPVIPDVRFSDLGLVDVLGKKLIPFFSETEA